MIFEEELDGIDRDDLKDLLGLVPINEERGNPKAVVDGGEFTRNITQGRSQTFYKPVDVHSVTNAIGESFFSINVWNIVNQLDRHDFFCESVVNNLKEKQVFSDQMNRNLFDLILAGHYWNCSTIENLRCLKSVVNEII